MNVSELRKQIHNLACQRRRLGYIQTDPDFREKERKRGQEYYLTHKEQINKRTTEYRKNHREWFNQYKRDLYRRNHE